jgi:flavin-dependent dehydrogenase
MYDAIIVGARCAGSPTAMLLARKGYRVLVVDKATFPSDTMSTHLMHFPAVDSLKRWGLYDEVMATGAPRIPDVTLDYHGVRLAGTPPPLRETDHWLCPRRTLLDDILVRAARGAGAEVREKFTVSEILLEGERVVGIRGRDGKNGTEVEERARIVIGADGRNSMVARAVDAARYNEIPPKACGYYSYWEGVETSGFEFYVWQDRCVGLFATNDGLTCVFNEWPHEQFADFRKDVEGNYLRTNAAVPGLQERMAGAKRVERIIGTQDTPNFFRVPFGPGWALVGDAGYHKDPITGQGITDAFRDAELLANAVDEGFSGAKAYDEAMAHYQAERDADAGPAYMRTMEMASLRPAAEPLGSVFKAVPQNPDDLRQFLGVVAGSVPFAEFFTPENINRLSGKVPAAA